VPPRFTLLFLPTSCPKANPLERACGEAHDKCTRTHQRNRLAELVRAVAQHWSTNGPWLYNLSPLSYTPAVTTVVDHLSQEQRLLQAV
jgi:hypothetical protein